ncbi:cysH: phosophoadenylyl-sulfate reductase [Gaiella occulta]|uniref:Adenosine 5'-phosphosulfate reductase n=1 Tax=Gaiella occulta TaxID=1002870 RepID=A0A7M2YZJ7_9ACTN|nr:phosphoadenylyl-sulfate reductase [Gaiella occulta]RDI75567.1 cysH: phosophoadenylyl-sulfate reductase [Gaiella occulta]
MTTDVATLLPGTDVEALTAPEVLGVMVEHFHPSLSLACSFQKEEAVLLDMLLAIEPGARVFALDTHVLFPETYDVWRAVEKRYGVRVEVYQGPSLGRQAAAHGDALWASNPALCCAIRKVGPLGEALSGLRGWITGMRRDQSPTRAGAPKIAWDERHELWKANPLADWRDGDVWAYIHERELPYNRLHDRGYASIGCTHCTLPGDGREGRWAGSDKTECGLHLDA